MRHEVWVGGQVLEGHAALLVRVINRHLFASNLGVCVDKTAQEIKLLQLHRVNDTALCFIFTAFLRRLVEKAKRVIV